MKVIAASEIGTYLFCRRAWWYAQQGVSPGNLETLMAGKDFHERHGSQVRSILLLRIAALVFLIFSITLGILSLVF